MKQQKRIFITGTDTDVGKTLVTCCLIEKLQLANYSVTALKPIAAGCESIDNQLKNSDALLLQQSMQQSLSYTTINPVALSSAIAPHIAAVSEGRELSVKLLQEQCDLSQHRGDFVLIEGAGGWLVPLNDDETMADFVIAESLGILLVVGIKLGCINHALLTVDNIESKGLKLIGWVANCIDSEMLVVEENIKTLEKRLSAPRLATIPYLSSGSLKDAGNYVNIAPLIRL